MVDHRTVKLGKNPPVAWPLKTAQFFTPELPEPPTEFHNSRGISQFGMMLNDKLGCCVIAAGFHALQTLIMSQENLNIDRGLLSTIHPSDDLVLRYYEQWGGYIVGDDSTDQGMDITTKLKNWVKQGLGGYLLIGFADPHPMDLRHIKQSIALFGGIDIGLLLPLAWQGAKVWDMVPSDQPGSWGGHDVWVVDYDAEGLWCITWGELQRITWRGFQWACDEAHTLVSADFKPMVGFDLAGLKTALGAIIG